MSYGPPQPVTPEEDTGEYPTEPTPKEPSPTPSGWRPVAYLGALLVVVYLSGLALVRYTEAAPW